MKSSRPSNHRSNRSTKRFVSRSHRRSLTALVCGVIAIKVLVNLLVRGAFHRFAPYCWALGGGTLLWAVFRA